MTVAAISPYNQSLYGQGIYGGAYPGMMSGWGGNMMMGGWGGMAGFPAAWQAHPLAYRYSQETGQTAPFNPLSVNLTLGGEQKALELDQEWGRNGGIIGLIAGTSLAVGVPMGIAMLRNTKLPGGLLGKAVLALSGALVGVVAGSSTAAAAGRHIGRQIGPLADIQDDGLPNQTAQYMKMMEQYNQWVQKADSAARQQSTATAA